MPKSANISAPLVSIIIPVYNRVTYLGETIESVLAQNFANWELIIIDDGSQEDVAGYVSRFADPRIRFVRQENHGNAAARNTGIDQATGNYLICLDSDDVWHSTMLKACGTFLDAHPEVDVVCTQMQTIGGNGETLPHSVGPPLHDGDLLEPLLMGYPILPSSALVRRSCFERWGAYTPGLDDWELWLRWAAQGCRFASIERPLLHYRVHDQNFNLAYDRRRAAHFSMLDQFYSQEHLPPTVLTLRDRAYATQHFHFAVLAWQVGRPDDGMADFAAAILRYPAYLVDLDFYTRIACAHQGRIEAGTAHGLSLSMAESTLNQCLAALFCRPDLPEAVRQRKDCGQAWALLALARLAYSTANDMEQAQRWLWQSACAWPALVWRSDWAAWLARATVGYERLQAAKRMLGSGVRNA